MTEPMDESEQKFAAGAPLVIITGLSGAGKSTAMRLLSDLGCYCLDNLPPALVTDFFALYEQSEGASGGQGVAIASDVRSGALFDDFTDMVKALEASHVGFEILYLDCSAETLISRFKEVRRTHPLQVGLSMSEAIEEELLVAEPEAAPEDSLELREDLDALLGLDEEEPVEAAEAPEEPVLEADAQEDLAV